MCVALTSGVAHHPSVRAGGRRGHREGQCSGERQGERAGAWHRASSSPVASSPDTARTGAHGARRSLRRRNGLSGPSFLLPAGGFPIVRDEGGKAEGLLGGGGGRTRIRSRIRSRTRSRSRSRTSRERGPRTLPRSRARARARCWRKRQPGASRGRRPASSFIQSIGRRQLPPPEPVPVPPPPVPPPPPRPPRRPPRFWRSESICLRSSELILPSPSSS